MAKIKGRAIQFSKEITHLQGVWKSASGNDYWADRCYSRNIISYTIFKQGNKEKNRKRNKAM